MVRLVCGTALGYPYRMIRTGIGYDSHRFAAGRTLVLGGVRIEYSHGLIGHSDADVVLHAITDAILGALGAGDIGERFPDDDPQWKDADSRRFVREAVALAEKRGLRVGNCDVTVLAQQPRLAPHKANMRASIAGLLNVDAADVSVKAKTNEHMGFVGREEGLAALVSVLLTDE